MAKEVMPVTIMQHGRSKRPNLFRGFVKRETKCRSHLVKFIVAAKPIDEQITMISELLVIDLSNCSKPYVTSTGDRGGYWYRLWSDGWLEQGGALGMTAQGTGAVMFPKQYETSSDFVPVLTASYSGTGTGTENSGVWIQSWTAKMFMWVNKGPEGSLFWYTCGIAAE